MSTFRSREILRLAPGEHGIARFALQVMSILVGDGAHLHRPPREDVLALMVRGAMTGDPEVLARLTGEFRRHRIPPEAAVDVYIPAAVREIGDAWHEDVIDILDATVAVARLQNLVREFSRNWRADGAGREGSVLMVVPEGEPHTLGAMIATAQLRRRGVSVSLQLAPSRASLEERLASRRFDALFLSVGNHDSLESASILVKTMERVVRRRIPVLVGGAIPLDMDSVRRAIGADMATRDIGAALDFLGLQASCHAAQ